MGEKRKTYAITFNKGIDKASLPFEASPARALDALNYLYRDGKVQKRYGVNHLLNVEETKYYATIGVGAEVQTNATDFNGLWRFKAEDGAYHMVAHIGKLLYEVVKDDKDDYSLYLFSYGRYLPIGGHTARPRCYELENFKSTAVIGNRSLYVFGGKKLLRVRFVTNAQATSGYSMSCVPVTKDESTYIPTTSISITYRNAKASGRASLDQANLMTPWRKNLLLSGVGIDKDNALVYDDSSIGYVYQLDGPIVGKALEDDVSNIRVKITRRKYYATAGPESN